MQIHPLLFKETLGLVLNTLNIEYIVCEFLWSNRSIRSHSKDCSAHKIIERAEGKMLPRDFLYSTDTSCLNLFSKLSHKYPKFFVIVHFLYAIVITM